MSVVVDKGEPTLHARITKETQPVKLLLTIEEAAQALGVGKTQVYELILHRCIPSVKIGRSRRVPIAALQAFIEQQLQLD